MLRADNLTTLMCRLSRNLGTSTPGTVLACNSPVQGLFCFSFTFLIIAVCTKSLKTTVMSEMNYKIVPYLLLYTSSGNRG